MPVGTPGCEFNDRKNGPLYNLGKIWLSTFGIENTTVTFIFKSNIEENSEKFVGLWGYGGFQHACSL